MPIHAHTFSYNINKSHHVELCRAIWNTHECASHLPAHRSKALLLPAIIANLESSKVSSRGKYWRIVESCGTMWNPSNPRTLNGRRIKSFRRLQAEPVPPKPKAGAASPALSSGCRRTSENHQTHI